MRRAELLLELIARRKERIAEDFYDIGKALHELSHKKLYLALGHPSFADMLSKRNVMSLTGAKVSSKRAAKGYCIVIEVPAAAAASLVALRA